MAATYPSDYAMRIVYLPTGAYHEWVPGSPTETLLVQDLCGRVAEKGVGIGRTTTHVVADVRAAIEELIFDLKKQV